SARTRAFATRSSSSFLSSRGRPQLRCAYRAISGDSPRSSHPMPGGECKVAHIRSCDVTNVVTHLSEVLLLERRTEALECRPAKIMGTPPLTPGGRALVDWERAARERAARPRGPHA